MRELAGGYGLALANKPDSQEICFIPGGDDKRFIDAYLEERRSRTGHRGRAGFGGRSIPGNTRWGAQLYRGTAKGTRSCFPFPLYVISIDRDSKRVTVGAEPELLRDSLRAHRLNWISIARLDGEMRAQVKIPASARTGLGHAAANRRG